MEPICRRHVEHHGIRYDISVWKHLQGYIAAWTCLACSETGDSLLSRREIECAVMIGLMDGD
jgi:hypothetical protein